MARNGIEAKMTGRRVLIYVVGVIVMALGIDLNSKTMLGISPINSISYNVSQTTNWSLGSLTFVYYVILTALQVMILRKEFKMIQILQVPYAFVTSVFIELFDRLIPLPEQLSGRICFLCAGIIITAVGASFVVGMKIVPNPADGLAVALGNKIGKGFGFGKNILDFTCIMIALLIGFIATGGVLGIGIGTLISMIFIGRVIALLQNTSKAVFRWTQGDSADSTDIG